MPTHSHGLHTGRRPTGLEKISGLPLHVVIIFLDTTLGVIVEFRYEILKKSLSEEHGIIVEAIVVSLSLYALACMAQYKLRSRTNDFKRRIIRRFTPLLGIFVAVLLLKILLPLLGLAAIIIWALFMLEAIIKTGQESLEWIRLAIPRIIGDIGRNYLGLGGGGDGESERNTMTEENGLLAGNGTETESLPV